MLAAPFSKCEQHVQINVVYLTARRSLWIFAPENIQRQGSPQTYPLRPQFEKKINKCTNLTMVIV